MCKKILTSLFILQYMNADFWPIKKNEVSRDKAIAMVLSSKKNRQKRYKNSFVSKKDLVLGVNSAYLHQIIGEFDKTSSLDLETLSEIKADYYESMQVSYEDIIDGLRTKYREHPELMNKGAVRLDMYYITAGTTVNANIVNNTYRFAKDFTLDLNNQESIENFRSAYFKMCELRFKSFEFMRTTHDKEYTNQQYKVHVGVNVTFDYGIDRKTAIKNSAISIVVIGLVVFGGYSAVKIIRDKFSS